MSCHYNHILRHNNMQYTEIYGVFNNTLGYFIVLGYSWIADQQDAHEKSI